MDALSRRLLMAGSKRRGIQYVGGRILPITSFTSTPSIGLSSLTGGLASSPAPGDLVIAMVLLAFGADEDISATGYTEIADLYSIDTNGANLYVGRKFMGISPDSSVTFDLGVSSIPCCGVSVWRGIDADNPLDVTPTTATGIDTDRPNPPAITPSSPGSRIVVIGGGAGDGSDDLAQAGSELSDFMSDTSVGGSTHRLAFGHYDDWTSGSFDPTAFVGGQNGGKNAWAAATIALRPA